MSSVPSFGGIDPASLVMIVDVPYGWTNVYAVSGHRPPLTVIRIRPKTICSFATGAPLTNVPSIAVRMKALPSGPPSQPGVVIGSESATV